MRKKIKIIFYFTIIQVLIIITFQLLSKHSSNQPFVFYNLNDSKFLNEIDFIIGNSTCYIPKLDIWHSSIKSLLTDIVPYNRCIKHLPFTYIENRLFLKFNQSINKTYFNGQIKYCQLAVVLRNTTIRDDYKLSKFVNITDGIELTHDFVKIRCFGQNDTKQPNYTIVYEYVHAILYKRNDLKRLEIDETTNNKLNVLVMILDSVSTSSFKRSLNKTYNYFKKFKNFYLFEKHHVVGINTIENIVPMLVNKKADEIYNSSANFLKKSFDDVDFIWKNFKKNDYLTFFTEEWRESTFNNLKYGFNETPTDYYLRHYWMALYDSLAYPPSKLNSNNKPCYYDKLLHHLTLDWIKQFHDVYTDNGNSFKIPIFGIFKMNEMSHDYLERLKWIDDDLFGFFNYLFTDSFLDKTLFILMGDHGHRQHSIRQTLVGRLEEKLPFFSMLVPRVLLKKNPALKETLKLNTQKLTTWWDVYETLSHLLNDQIDIKSNRINNQNKNGKSLFTDIEERSCKETNIPSSLCSCGAILGIQKKTPIIDAIAYFIVNYINESILKSYKKICMEYTLKEIIEAQVIKNDVYNKYIVILKVAPNDAVFDATVIDKDENSLNITHRFEIVDQIQRITQYGITSKCVDVYYLRNYCYCKDYHKKAAKYKG